MADDSSEIVREQSESVAATNLKTLGDAPSFYTAQGYANAVSYQQAMNLETLRQSGLNGVAYAKAIDRVLNTSPEEGVAPVTLAEILSKTGGNTPPVTP